VVSFHIFFTILLFIVFIAIVLWAYSKKRKQDFAEAERLPFIDEQNQDHKGGQP